jgi:hypothetical protein
MLEICYFVAAEVREVYFRIPLLAACILWFQESVLMTPRIPSVLQNFPFEIIEKQ